MSTRSVLVVDDEPDIRSLLQEILEDEGYDVSVAETASAAQKAVDEQRPDLVLLDIWMPDMDGVSLLKSWKLSGTLAFPVIMISGHGTVETAVEATRHGAVDFIEKPVSLAKLLLTVERAFAEVGQAAANDTQGAPTPALLPQLLGDSEFVVSLRDRLEEVSVRSNPVLLVGEQGSGRLLFAQNVHERSKSLEGPFIHLRCDTLSSANAHRELYGEQSGDTAFAGYLESAAGGTLCLTDVELLPPSAQTCLRQAIDQKGFMRVDGNFRVPLRCRMMSTSRQDLTDVVKRNAFDATLAHQLTSETIVIAPLRSHPEDIPALLEGFVDWHVKHEGLPYRHFTLAAQNRLRNLDWLGNLLELKNLVQRVLLLGGGTEIEVTEVDKALGTREAPDSPEQAAIVLRHDLPLREARADFERRYLLRCLAETQGNIGDLAKHVGMERTHLYRKLRSLDIDLDKVRDA
jgi:DNA-binding NtrC family response regulator